MLTSLLHVNHMSFRRSWFLCCVSMVYIQVLCCHSAVLGGAKLGVKKMNLPAVQVRGLWKSSGCPGLGNLWFVWETGNCMPGICCMSAQHLPCHLAGERSVDILILFSEEKQY